MYSACVTPRTIPIFGISLPFISTSDRDVSDPRSSTRVVNTPPSCIVCIGGFPYPLTLVNTTAPSLTIASTWKISPGTNRSSR
jgi:hypothetical protein